MSLYQKSTAKKILANKKEINLLVEEIMNDAATIVGSSFGPGGSATLIERDGLSPLATKDGVTIMRSLGVDDAAKNIILESAKEICVNTAREAGDGTTASIILGAALVRHGQEFLQSNPKCNPQRLINEIKEAYDTVVVPTLKSRAIKVENDAQLLDVAKISANGDQVIAEAVVKAVNASGDDGTVLIEEGQSGKIEVEIIEGFIATTGLKELDRAGPLFINDRAGQQVKMDNGVVFLFNGSMLDLKAPAAVQEALEGSGLMGCPILIFAHDYSDVVLERFAKNVRGGFNICPLKTPFTPLPNSRLMFLEDVAAYTGAKIFDPENVLSLDENGFGSFEKAKATMFESIIFGKPSTENIDRRVGELKALMGAAKSDYDRMFIKASIGKLTGGISTIWVGGASELEIREKKARVEDAVEAVRSAVAEGVIPGGCSVHVMLANMINTHPQKKPSWDILAVALGEPFHVLMSNCGEDPGSVAVTMLPHIMKAIQEGKLPNQMFDASSHSLVDPWVAGIIEPAKVCRVSLANAISVASLLINLKGIVVVPRDRALEGQLAMGEQAFKQMMSASGGDM